MDAMMKKRVQKIAKTKGYSAATIATALNLTLADVKSALGKTKASRAPARRATAAGTRRKKA
jgi:hypothetical protein